MYKHQQVFNMDEMDLQWKRMPEHIHHERGDVCPCLQSIQRLLHPPTGANLMVEYKLNPILVCHAENPHALVGYGKTSLPFPSVRQFYWLNARAHFLGIKLNCLGVRVEGVLHVLRASPSIS